MVSLEQLLREAIHHLYRLNFQLQVSSTETLSLPSDKQSGWATRKPSLLSLASINIYDAEKEIFCLSLGAQEFPYYVKWNRCSTGVHLLE